MVVKLCSLILMIAVVFVSSYPPAKPVPAAMKSCCAEKAHHACPLCPGNSAPNQCCCERTAALLDLASLDLKAPADFAHPPHRDVIFNSLTRAPLSPPPKPA